MTVRERWRLAATTMTVLAVLLLLVAPWCAPWAEGTKLSCDACVLLMAALGCLIAAVSW